MDFRAVFLSTLLLATGAFAQTAAKPIEANGAARPANSQSTYAGLRADMPGTDGVTVKDFTLTREGGSFHFDQGSFYFYAPVEGRTTGAVFVGKGRFELTVTDVGEQRSLALLTKSTGMSQDFTTLVLRFTDGTAEEIRKASGGPAGAPEGRVREAGEDLVKAYRRELHENLELRLLADVVGGNPGGFFMASFRMGGSLSRKNVLFIVDPEGTFHSAPDEVELSTWDESDLEPWAAYRMHLPDGRERGLRVQVTDEKLDVTIDRSGVMKTSAETTLKLRRDGVRVVRLNLYPTLRVSGVYSESGAPLDFVQEDKLLDPDFAVILPGAAKKGDTLRLLTVYGGKDALLAEGNDNYYLLSGARESWYPSGGGELGDFINFHMTFHIPKILQIVATGKQVSVTPEEGGMVKAVWETNAPIPVAGFNLGAFKMKDAKTPQGFEVSAYVNVDLPGGLSVENVWGGGSIASALPDELCRGARPFRSTRTFSASCPMTI
jgi:hypothetical protein